MKASLTSPLRSFASVASPVALSAYPTPRSILARALLQARQLTKANRFTRIACHQRINMGKGVQGFASACCAPPQGRFH